jgi:hypothetical protein
MTTMTISQFVQTVNATNTIFGVSFIKKTTGELRDMVARMHVSKGVKGVLPEGQRKAEDARNAVLTVYDMQVLERLGEKGAFRRINLSDLISCTIRGTRYVWNPEQELLVAD